MSQMYLYFTCKTQTKGPNMKEKLISILFTLSFLPILFITISVYDGFPDYDYTIREKLIKESKLDYWSLKDTKDLSGNDCREYPEDFQEYMSNDSILVAIITLMCDKGDTIGHFIKTGTTYDYKVAEFEGTPITFRFPKFHYRAIVKLDTIHLSVLKFLRFQ